MGDKSHKAYAYAHDAHMGEIMPYTVSDSGFARGPDTIKSGANVCPALDNDSEPALSRRGTLRVQHDFDMTTDSPATLTGDALPTPQISRIRVDLGGLLPAHIL